MKYKVLVLDLDGTLTNSKKKITDYTKKILLNLQKKGVHIVLASGRPEYGIWPIAKELELEKYGGYILAFNGGKIVECSTKKTIFERTIEYSYVQEIYEQVKDKKVALLTYENDSLITETPKDFSNIKRIQLFLYLLISPRIADISLFFKDCRLFAFLKATAELGLNPAYLRSHSLYISL